MSLISSLSSFSLQSAAFTACLYPELRREQCSAFLSTIKALIRNDACEARPLSIRLLEDPRQRTFQLRLSEASENPDAESEILLEARAREQKQGFFQIDFGRIALAQLELPSSSGMPSVLTFLPQVALGQLFAQTKEFDTLLKTPPSIELDSNPALEMLERPGEAKSWEFSLPCLRSPLEAFALAIIEIEKQQRESYRAK